MLDENSRPVPHIRVEASPANMAMGAGIPYIVTDENGHFQLTIPVVIVPTSEGRVNGRQWGVSAVGDYYPTVASAFYKTSPNRVQHVTITPEEPEVDVVLRLGSKAGALVGHVSDTWTGGPLMPELEFTWASEPSNRMTVRVGQPYRVLLPANTDIKVVARCEEHKPWFYPATIRVDPGREMRLDIKLEPLVADR